MRTKTDLSGGNANICALNGSDPGYFANRPTSRKAAQREGAHVFSREFLSCKPKLTEAQALEQLMTL